MDDSGTERVNRPHLAIIIPNYFRQQGTASSIPVKMNMKSRRISISYTSSFVQIMQHY